MVKLIFNDGVLSQLKTFILVKITKYASDNTHILHNIYDELINRTFFCERVTGGIYIEYYVNIVR